MLKETILRLCKEHKITVSNLEKTLGFANSTISRWDKFTPRVDNVKKVADYFGVTIDYLLEPTPEQEEIYEQNQQAFERREQKRRVDDNDSRLLLQELKQLIKSYGGQELVPETKKIPIISTIKCGNNGLAYEDIDGYIMVDESMHGQLIVLRTRGDSMRDAGIDEGDLAIVRIQDDIESGEIAAVLIDGEEATLKRVVKLPVGIALEGASPSYKTRYFTGAETNRIRIIGKLLEVRKKF